jgi:hypothetical protein
MEHFDPQRHVRNCSLICEADGTWPSFHDANVYTINLWHGDLRPEDDVWIGPQIDVTLGLSSLREPTPVAVVQLRFSDCDAIELSGFTYGGAMLYELNFNFEERGFYQDGVTPLPPYIWVVFSFGASVKPLLRFRCFSVTALARHMQKEPPYA